MEMQTNSEKPNNQQIFTLLSLVMDLCFVFSADGTKVHPDNQ